MNFTAHHSEDQLFDAARRGEVLALQAALAAGVPVDAANDKGFTALILASWASSGDSVSAREDGNLLDLARLVVHAALAREESRGAHYRVDFPETSPFFERHLSWVRKVVARVD